MKKKMRYIFINYYRHHMCRLETLQRTFCCSYYCIIYYIYIQILLYKFCRDTPPSKSLCFPFFGSCNIHILRAMLSLRTVICSKPIRKQDYILGYRKNRAQFIRFNMLNVKRKCNFFYLMHIDTFITCAFNL